MKMKINFDYFKDKKNIAWIAFFALLLIAMIVMSVGAGMNGDEEMQATHAGNVLDYYQSFGKDTAAVSTTYIKNDKPEFWNLPYYGQVVDNLASFIARLFNIERFLLRAIKRLANTEEFSLFSMAA
jgi:hypothetical protein